MQDFMINTSGRSVIDAKKEAVLFEYIKEYEKADNEWNHQDKIVEELVKQLSAFEKLHKNQAQKKLYYKKQQEYDAAIKERNNHLYSLTKTREQITSLFLGLKATESYCTIRLEVFRNAIIKLENNVLTHNISQ